MDLATLGIRIENGEVVATTDSLDRMTAAGSRAEKQTGALESASKRLAAAFGLWKLLQLAQDTVALADRYTNLHSRLSLVTTGSENLARTQERLFQVSQQTRTELESNVTLYSALARSTKELHLQQDQLVNINRAIAQSYQISGASASESAASSRQLAQAMASGVLRGDEFNSIAENAPRIQAALASSLHVTNGELRAMAEQGKLTSGVIANALLKDAEAINREFERMPLTVGGAITQLKNAALVKVGREDDGASAALAESISLLARNLDTAVDLAEALVAVGVARWAGSATASLVAYNRSLVLANAESAAYAENTLRVAEANVAATAAERERTAAVLASLQADRAAVQMAQAEAAARLQAANARMARAVDPASLAPLGGAVVAREMAAQNAAIAARSVALRELATLGSQHARLNQSIAATEVGLTSATTAATAAIVRQSEAIAAGSFAARAGAAAMGVFRGAVAALGGPIGVAILAAMALNEVLDHYGEKALKAAEQTDKQKDATDRALAAAHARAAGEAKAAEALSDAQKKAAKALKDVLDAGVLSRIAAQREFDGVSLIGAAREKYNLATERMLALKRAEQTLSGAALAASKLEIANTFELRDATLGLVAAIEREAAARKLALANRDVTLSAEIEKTGERAEKEQKVTDAVKATTVALQDRLKAAIDAGERQAAVEKKYVDDMQAIWRSGITKIVTDGTKSFRDFFEDVLQLFTRLMARMEQQGKTDGLGYKLLGLGSSAITGGFAGYQIGQQSGSSGTGVLGGAASGAASGFAIAGQWGAVVGGLVGAVGGLLGASAAQRDAADKLRAAGEALLNQANTARENAAAYVSASLDSPLDQALLAESQRFGAVLSAVGKAAEAGAITLEEYQKIYGDVNKAMYHNIELIKQEAALKKRQLEEDVQVQILRNNGMAEQADALARQVDQERRFAALRKEGLDDATIAALALSEAAKAASDAAIAARENMRAIEDFAVRTLRAQGRGTEADRAAFENGQRREFQTAIDEKRPADYIASLQTAQFWEGIRFNIVEQTNAAQAAGEAQQRAYDAQISAIRGQQEGIQSQIKAIEEASSAAQRMYDEQLKVARDALAVNQEQLRTAEQNVQATQRVMETLAQYSAGLKLNTSLTTLSPTQQLVEAKRQYDTMIALANGGDRSAADSLPGAGNAYLSASRAVNASGAAYIADFLKVQQSIASVTDRFGVQLTTEQRILSELEAQNGALERQIGAINDAKELADAAAKSQIAALQNQLSAMAEQIAAIERAKDAAEENTRRQIKAIEEGALAAATAYLAKWDAMLALLDTIKDGSKPATPPGGVPTANSADVISAAVAAAVVPVVTELKAGRDAQDEVIAELRATVATLQTGLGALHEELAAFRAEAAAGDRSTIGALEGIGLRGGTY